MMKKIFNLYTIFVFILISLAAGCSKSAFLAKKPSADIISPSTLDDFQELLDNSIFFNTDALSQESCDDYETSYAGWEAAETTERNAYIWAKDLYGGNPQVSDWNTPYTQIFYANNVLDGLAAADSAASSRGNFIRGQALFKRSYAFYNLTRSFCKGYDSASASTDLGIPLRTDPDINVTTPRSTLQQSFDRILADLHTSIPLLPSLHPATDPTRPSKAAAYGLLARIYLDMRNYTQAGLYADSSLQMYNTLIDYNTVSMTSATPFSRTNAELIYQTSGQGSVNEFILGFVGYYSSSTSRITPEVLALYGANDLRFSAYFKKLSDGSYQERRGYIGVGWYPFTGLATDEMYLIKAECLARAGAVTAAMDELNALLIMRFSNTTPYVPLTASSSADALAKVLLERRKELVWRNLRWHDLKRLNLEGANITLTRTLNGVVYTLPPNDPRYVFPIPDDEIALSGIQQNQR